MKIALDSNLKSKFFRELGKRSLEQYNSNSQNSSENNTDYSPAFYWFPLAKIKKNIPVISFDFEYFDDENKMNLLKNIFISHKIKKVTIVPEFENMYTENDWDIAASDDEGYDLFCSEQFLFDDSHTWLIYTSHEFTITFAGEWLANEIKNVFDERYKSKRFYANSVAR